MTLLRSTTLTIRFNPTPFYRAMAEAGALLALVVVREPRRRWQLQYRVERIRRRRTTAAR